MQSLAATAGDSVIVPRNLHTAGAAALSTLEVHGTTDQGVAIQYAFHGVFTYDGGFNRIEYFADDQWDAALARLDELGAAAPADPRHPRAENTATRTRGQVLDRLNDARFDDAGAFLREDFERVDRRTVVSMPTAHGRDTFVESSRATFDAGFTHISYEPIAVRGDRLELSRVTMRAADGHEMVFLNIGEVDETGRASSTTSFDEDAFAEAHAELDERYLAGEGAPHARTLAVDAPVRIAVRDDDGQALDRSSHRISSRSTISESAPATGDRAWLLDQEDADSGSSPVPRVRPHGICHGRRGPRRPRVHGGPIGTAASSTGRPSSSCTSTARTASIGSSGSTSRTGTRRSPASTSSAPRRPPTPATHAPRTPRPAPGPESSGSSTTGRFDEARALLTDDLERVDRRTVVSMPTTRGLDDFVEASRASLDAGFTYQSHVPIAVRGDRLELSRVTMRSAEGYELVFLSIIEIDESGRVRGTTSFDEDALEAAVAELDARYVAGEGAPYAPMLDTAIRTLAALQAEDWTALTALLTDDYTFVDHRQLANPALDRRGTSATQQMFAEQIRRRMVVRTFHPVDGASSAPST